LVVELLCSEITSQKSKEMQKNKLFGRILSWRIEYFESDESVYMIARRFWNEKRHDCQLDLSDYQQL
jgi:hypothetical protein